MATAYAARKLNLPATIVLPSSTPQLVAQKLKDQGATVKVVGKARAKYHHRYPKCLYSRFDTVMLSYPILNHLHNRFLCDVVGVG